MILKLRKHFRSQHYCVAVASVLVALLLTHQLWQQFQPALYPFFLAAVMISCWYGGLGPGLLATVLGALFSEYFFLPPRYSLAISSANFFRQLYFVSIALLICTLTARLRSTQQQAERHAQAAEQHQALLLQNQEILRQSEERYRLLVEGVTDYAILMLDSNGHIISWNAGAEQILGYREDEVLGEPFARIFTPEAVHRINRTKSCGKLQPKVGLLNIAGTFVKMERKFGHTALLHHCGEKPTTSGGSQKLCKTSQHGNSRRRNANVFYSVNKPHEKKQKLPIVPKTSS